MGDLATLAKARRELEELYLGVPDDSVNLTFQDFAEVQQQHATSSLEKKKSTHPMHPICEGTPKRAPPSLSPLTKIPSLDFSRGLEASANFHHQAAADHHHHHHHHRSDEEALHASQSNRHNGHGDRASNGQGRHHDRHAVPYSPRRAGDRASSGHGHQHDGHAIPYSPRKNVGLRFAGENSVAFDDASHMSGTSMASMAPFQERGGRRRPGIPHSNICTICSVYIYVFRHRCLVCGRVYCRECLAIGMGEMTEGRKCIECLGKRFSQRYIQRAGKVGCWTGCCARYPSTVKHQELKWAEKGPRNSGENRYGRSEMVSRSKSPMTPRTPTRAHSATSPPSFVVGSPYPPYSSTNHHLPL